MTHEAYSDGHEAPELEVKVYCGDDPDPILRRLEKLGEELTYLKLRNERFDTREDSYFSNLGLSPRVRKTTYPSGHRDYRPSVKLRNGVTANGSKSKNEWDRRDMTTPSPDIAFERLQERLVGELRHRRRIITPAARIQLVRTLWKDRVGAELEDDSKKNGFSVHVDFDTPRRVSILKARRPHGPTFEDVQPPPEGNLFSRILEIEGKPQDIKRAARALHVTDRLRWARKHRLSHASEGDIVKLFQIIEKGYHR